MCASNQTTNVNIRSPGHVNPPIYLLCERAHEITASKQDQFISGATQNEPHTDSETLVGSIIVSIKTTTQRVQKSRINQSGNFDMANKIIGLGGKIRFVVFHVR